MTNTHRRSLPLILAGLLAGLAAMLACAVTPATSVRDDKARESISAAHDSDSVEIQETSWQAPASSQASVETLNDAGTSEDRSPSDSTELDADSVVAAYERVIGDVHESVLPSVVSIFVLNRVEISGTLPGFTVPFPFNQGTSPDGNSQREFYYQNGQGSGFVWDNEGHIVTNRHVVADAERIRIVFSDGRDADAEIVGMDEDSDLAVLKVDKDVELLTPVSLGDSNEVRVGQLAITIGNPFGQEFSTTTGIVSAIGRTIRTGDSHFSLPKVIQTDASMNPGNSGGPLLDRKGRVIGIDAQIISRGGASTGIGFAIPVNIAKQVVPELISSGTFTYSWLGIRGTTISPEAVELMSAPEGTRGALVIALADDGPADNAGLEGSTKTKQTDEGGIRYGGDVITAIDGNEISGMNELIIYLLENTRPGDAISVSVVRDGGETAEIAVTLQARPE
ncbi:MAG: trypsin-like peptidase domain-containing protein [Chloroflexi bacterium]|nr:trypsin-like peptidase domain-containing protein [Chloroflexota bacterium]